MAQGYTNHAKLDGLGVARDGGLGLTPIDLCILARLKFKGQKHLGTVMVFFPLDTVMLHARLAARVTFGL